MNRGIGSGIQGLALALVLLAGLAPWGLAQAQRQFIGSLAAFSGVDVEGTGDALGDVIGEGNKGAGELFKWGVKTVGATGEFADRYRGLGDDDGDYDPLGMDDGFQAPSQCGDDEDCQGCYRTATERLDFNRYYLHRAWSITTQYTRFAEGAKAFGDSTSGVHGVAGLSWQLQGRPPIDKALGQLRNTYRDKYRSYIEGAEAALKQMGECEAQYAGDDRWFGRYAALYLSLVKSKYQIED